MKLENSISADLQNANIEEVNLLEEKKTRLQEKRTNTIDGVIIRSRSRYEDLGEKPSSYFFGLEKKNYTNKVITKIIENDGHECTTTNEILNSQKTYYKTLYSEKNVTNDNPIALAIGENHIKLSENESESLEGDIKYSELAEALKNMKNSKTPGSDGFPAEFFKFFWIDLKFFILKSLNYGYKTGSLSITQSNKDAKIRNRYNQVPHLTQDTNGKVTNSQKTPQTRAKRSALSQQVTTKHI